MASFVPVAAGLAPAPGGGGGGGATSRDAQPAAQKAIAMVAALQKVIVGSLPSGWNDDR